MGSDSAGPRTHTIEARGILAGAVAGACWGFVFLTPDLVRGFTPAQLAIGRYLGYGILALLLVAPRLPGLWARLGRREWLALFGLSLVGNLLYYILLASAVQWGGVAMPSLVVGFLPVAVTLIGSRHHGAVPVLRLSPALLLAMAGMACVGWQWHSLVPASRSRSQRIASQWLKPWFHRKPIHDLHCSISEKTCT